jgi:hypothetical protein
MTMFSIPPIPSHTTWLKRSAKKLATKDGKAVLIFELKVDLKDPKTLSAWAKHFREHYCLDSQLDMYRKGTNKSRGDYLTDLVFPDATDDFGPATRSGDFAEILVSDLLQSQYGFFVPRTRYGSKTVRNESTKGSDIIGLKLESGDPTVYAPSDVLIAFETKAQLKSKSPKNRLQDAVNDSTKDKLRLAESLNAMNRRLIDLSRFEEAEVVQRFQEPIGRPYKRRSGAAAVYCTSLYQPASVSATDCTGHENHGELRLVVVHAKDLMALVHSLYQRAADEAK